MNELRIWVAMMLARDVGTCERLLQGEPVSPERIHREWLKLANELALVRLDIFAIDLLHRRAELRSLLNEVA